KASGSAAYVRAVPVAVQRVRVGVGRPLRLVRTSIGQHRAGIVSVANEVRAALDLGPRSGTKQGRIGRQRVGRIRLLEGGDGARPAEVGVGVIEARVDDADLDA